MGHQAMFLSLMEDVMEDEKLSMNALVKESHKKLLEACESLDEIIDKGALMLEINQGFEFLPFCCTGGDDAKFDFVWVGINPGIVKGRWPNRFYWDKTTWQEMVDFYIPKDKVSKYKDKGKKSTNFYQWIAEDGVWSKFYQVMIRIHFGLLENKVYGTWDSFRDEHDNDNKRIAKAFLEQLDKYPTLNAELIPFKSSEIQMNADKMVACKRYMNYFNHLVKFIDDNAKDDAWIVFFATTDVVRVLLNKQDAVNNLTIEEKPRTIDWEKANGKKFCGGKNFYLGQWGKRKLILSPFLQSYHDNGKDVSLVIKEIRKAFKV